MVEPKLLELMFAKLADLDHADFVAERMKLNDKAIEIDIDVIYTQIVSSFGTRGSSLPTQVRSARTQSMGGARWIGEGSFS